MAIISNLVRRLKLVQSFRRLFDTPDGQEVLKTIAREGFVFKSTFVAGDPYQTTLNEGSRRLALSIMKLANTDDGALIKMMEEHEQKEE